jgi:hypothetical protein
MRTFVIGIPGQDRTTRHEAETLSQATMRLDIGYKVVGEVVDGVAISPALPDGLKRYSFLTSILRDHGLELREWLAENGCVCKCGGSNAKESLDPSKNRGRQSR